MQSDADSEKPMTPPKKLLRSELSAVSGASTLKSGEPASSPTMLSLIVDHANRIGHADRRADRVVDRQA